jgi:uncharacterized membrane protein
VLSVSWDTIRLFLHVLAATVWVGGQLTLAAVVPVLRRFGGEVPRAAVLGVLLAGRRQLVAARQSVRVAAGRAAGAVGAFP